MKNYDVSIIVPIYNAEKCIAKCATTLMEQDHKNIEYIFVNDCTPDNSMKVLNDTLAKYPNRKNDIKILHNTQNSGPSITRKNGLDIANGEYILFIDSDDWVELDMTSSMLKKAKETDADIVCCDCFMNYNLDKNVYIKQKYDQLDNLFEGIVTDFVYSYLCNKLYSRKLFIDVKFPFFILYEDYYLNIQLFYKTSRIYYLNKAFLHYNKTNTLNITKTNMSEAKINDIKNFYETTIELFKTYGILDKYKKYIQTRSIVAVFNFADKDHIKILKRIDKNLVDISIIWQNNIFGLFKKIGLSLPFFGLGFLILPLKRIYIKFKKLL